MSAQELERKLNIGLVDNSTVVLPTNGGLFLELGHQPWMYPDPTKLYDELLEDRLVIDGLIVRADMIPLNGTQLARRVKRIFSEMPIIGLGFDTRQWTLNSRQYFGIDAVIMQPLGYYVAGQVAYFIHSYQADQSKFPIDQPPHRLVTDRI